LSIGIKIENINKINVNTAKVPIKYNTIRRSTRFEMTYRANINKNQETINRITITNKIVFFDKFLSPEINLIIYNLNSDLFKISV
jgi:hypothetical protein